MCGICGIYNFDGAPVLPGVLNEMNRKMIHRGPDDEGSFIDNNIGIAMRRLSIIDLEKGHQPISNEDQRYYVILNGEIYNYLELKEDLISKGHQFCTNTDTEVIVHLYEDHGIDMVHYLNGMFAFAILDNLTKELFIFRDRLGIKPLFYTNTSNSFAFSSDLSSLIAIKQVKKEIDFNSFLLYMGMSYVPYPKTILEDIYKLEPGRFIKISSEGRVTKETYWEIRQFETLYLSSKKDYQELVLSLLRDSIHLQMRSDVPVGTFLSGGIDSSCVAALLSEQAERPVKTFSIGFQGGLNELPYARMVSDKFETDHIEVNLSGEELPDIFPELIDKMDEPISDNALIPTLILSKRAAANGVKVILNGTGGDEIFGGYQRYLPQRQIWKVINSLPLPVRSLCGRLLGNFDFDKGTRVANPALSFIASISGINYSITKRLFNNKEHYKSMIENLTSIYSMYIPSNQKVKQHQLMYFDLRNYLVDDILSLLDKMTMAVSLEGRVPLLDHRIVQIGFQIPDQIKFSNRQLKGFFRNTLKDILPSGILNLPKAGFAGPTRYWVNKFLKRSMYQCLVNEPINLYQESLDIGVIKQALDNIEQYWRYSETLFALYIFSLWYRNKIEGKKIV